MTKRAVLYARVSTGEQNKDDSVSIGQQYSDMESLCDRNGWHIKERFEDCTNYRATQNPKKGKIVNPSGERADRPQLLEMLKLVRTGEVDAIVCWRDDRLVRHPRVAVLLEDALDIGDAHRQSKPKVGIYDATGAMIDRFTLSIKAAIWREENKRRAERVRMGREGTLKEGRWPGRYTRLGYKAIREEGKRGRRIVLADDEEVQTVRRIFELCDTGHSIRDIRDTLIAETAPQKYGAEKWEWHPAVISQILGARDYTGVATWNFADGANREIAIPQIIDRELWARCRKRIEANTSHATRNAKGVYLLQGIVRCGECNAAVGVHGERRRGKTMADGTFKVYNHSHTYYCTLSHVLRGIDHPRPHTWTGRKQDYRVWRYLVDQCINRPDVIGSQVKAKRAELQAQGDDLNGEITRAQAKMQEIDQQRAFYQRQAARAKMTESEFDARMDETEEQRAYWLEESDRLKELRDDARKIDQGLNYANQFLASLRKGVGDLDMTPRQLRALSAEARDKVLEGRRKIVLALCETVYLYASGRIKIEGVLDGSEASEFGLAST